MVAPINGLFVLPQIQPQQALSPQQQELVEENPALEDAQAAMETLQAAANNAQDNSGSLLDNELTEEEEKVVRELKQTDAEVRAHEQAHKNVAGGYAGAISYETVTGPDGREYAVGGSVDIDTSPIPGNPQATIQKLETVVRAALAPAQPSSEDFAVARAAQQGLLQARRELEEQRRAEDEEENASQNPVLELAADESSGLTEITESQQTQQRSELLALLNAISDSQNTANRSSSVSFNS